MFKNIDFIIPTRRPVHWVQRVLLSAHEKGYGHSNFYLIFDSDEYLLHMKGWLASEKEKRDLPPVHILSSRPGFEKNLNALRTQGVEASKSPFIYFQDDDDPLPQNLDIRLEYMAENPGCMAVFGGCHAIDNHGQIIEHIPATVAGSFMVPPLQGASYFPTYIHPLTGLFRRDLFKYGAMKEKYNYGNNSHFSFLSRVLHSGMECHFIPSLVRQTLLHSENDSRIFTPTQAKDLASCIYSWAQYIKNEEISSFQKEVARKLSMGEISTYQEIAALIEDKIMAK